MARGSAGRGLSGQFRAVAFTRGVMGRSGPWLFIWLAMWVMRKVSGRSSQSIILSEELKPGERIMISNARGTLDDQPLDAIRDKRGKAVSVGRIKRGRKRRRAAERAAAAEARATAKANGSRRGRRAAKREARRRTAEVEG